MKTIYGIPNCNKMKTIFDLFSNQKLDYTFHNYKKEGISTEKLMHWFQKYSIDDLVNKKGTTYKALSEEDRQKLTDPNLAIEILQKNTSLFKRPIVELADGSLVLDYLNNK